MKQHTDLVPLIGQNLVASGHVILDAVFEDRFGSRFGSRFKPF
jgi:hypothetical protein